MIDAVLEMGPDDGAWTAVDPVRFEAVRRTLRDLVSLIEKRKRHFVHPDGEDVRGELTEIDVKGVKQTVFDVSHSHEQVALHHQGHLDHIARQRGLRLV